MQLSNIIGHTQPKKLLVNALLEGRVAHAYLFHGSVGVGKKSMAGALAANLLCPNRSDDACGVCSVCRRITENKHPDFFLIETSGNNIKIEQIRDIQKKVQYKPYEGSKKVFVIPDSEKMTRDAANCLLKILEEPPADTVFLLTANNIYNLMPTIISRCQVIPMGKIPLDEIEILLLNKQTEPAKAKLFASLSDGLPGVALELAGSEKGQEIRELVFQLEDNIQKGDINELFRIAEDLDKKKELPEIIEQLLMWYRDRLIWLQTGDQNLILNMDRLDDLRNRTADKEKLITSINTLLEARSSLSQNVNSRLVLEVLLMRLSQIIS